ncbi:MAG: hypothetical protein GY906_06500 [bacterium]|nr:hypothetical protein [bacterium]
MGTDNDRDGRGVAIADFDNDGDPDIAINNGQGDSGIAERARARLYRNDVGNRRSWLQVELVGTRSNRDGIGAIVEIDADGDRQLRHAHAGSAYSAQHSKRLHFGLGSIDTAVRVTVSWPSGLVETHADISINQGIRITEDAGLELDVLPKETTLGGSS